MRDQEDICPVCGYLLCEGAHPHSFEFCKICGKKTIFLTTPDRLTPSVCSEAHDNDRDVCAVCGVGVELGEILRCIVIKGKIYKLLCFRCVPHRTP